MKTVARLFALSLVTIMSCALLVNIASATTLPDLAPSTDSTAISARDLLDQKVCLDDVYWLESRVLTLEDYNTFNDSRGYLHATNAEHTKSIWDQLALADQDTVRELTTHQAFLYIMGLPKYTSDEDFRRTVDYYHDIFISFYPGYVRGSLWRFVPYAVTKDLSPDQLCVLGHLIVDTEVYQKLKQALEPLAGLYSEQDIQSAFSPAEMTLHYDEIARAAQQIWPDISWAHASELPTGATGE